MKAASYAAPGAARDVLRLGEIEPPTPRPGEVLVRVHASAPNPSDVKLRAGLRGDGTLPFESIVPHSDGAGEIAALGDGVTGRAVGERVYIWNGQWQRPCGTCAQYIAVPAEQAPRLPDAVGMREGACIGIPVMTAHHAVLADGPVDGQTVLVTGGAGRVGRYAVQLAKFGGAHVIATVRSADKAELARQAGADTVVDYRETDVAAAVLAHAPAGVDRIVEVALGANIETSARVLKADGRIAAYGSEGVPRPELPFHALMFKNAVIHTLLIYRVTGSARDAMVRDLDTVLSDGRLSFPIAETYPLDRVAAAHEAVEAGRIGSVVVDIP